MTALFYSIELVCSLVIITISAASVILEFYKLFVDKRGDSGKGAGMSNLFILLSRSLELLEILNFGLHVNYPEIAYR